MQRAVCADDLVCHCKVRNFAHTHTHTHTYMHARTHAYTRTHIHTHKHTQDAYDSAYSYPDFLLQQRIADVMLNVSVRACHDAQCECACVS